MKDDKIEMMSTAKQPTSGVPLDKIVMPVALTAENGAKALLIGEFEEVLELECPSCDRDDDECDVCGGNGSYTYRVPVSWATIREIYAKAVKALGEQNTDCLLYVDPEKSCQAFKDRNAELEA
jgi:hypothetical protein